MAKWIKSNSTGVRYRLHSTRKHGVGFDRYFSIRYRVDGKVKEEGLGWATEGWTDRKAAAVLAELKANQTVGKGPKTLNESREIRRQADAEEAARIAEENAFQDRQNLLILEIVFNRCCEANFQKKSIRDEINYFKNWIGPNIGTKRLDEIRLLDLERIRKKMADAGKAPRSIQYVKSIVRQDDGITDRRMRVVFHTLRHSCASWLVNAGVELPVIAKILGHKTLSMTMRYSHVNDSSVKGAMALIDKHQEPNAKVIMLARNG